VAPDVDAATPAVGGGFMLKAGDQSPAVIGTSYDGTSFDLGAPGRRTVLFFYPKANTGG
jgi:peroxiredoxin